MPEYSIPAAPATSSAGYTGESTVTAVSNSSGPASTVTADLTPESPSSAKNVARLSANGQMLACEWCLSPRT